MAIACLPHFRRALARHCEDAILTSSRIIEPTSIEPIDAAILRHPFVRGLTDGSLPRPSFQSYAVQDGDRGVVKTLTKRHSPCRFGQRLCAFGRSLASTA